MREEDKVTTRGKIMQGKGKEGKEGQKWIKERKRKGKEERTEYGKTERGR